MPALKEPYKRLLTSTITQNTASVPSLSNTGHGGYPSSLRGVPFIAAMGGRAAAAGGGGPVGCEAAMMSANGLPVSCSRSSEARVDCREGGGRGVRRSRTGTLAVNEGGDEFRHASLVSSVACVMIGSNLFH